MIRVILLTLVGLLLQAGCQNDLQLETLPLPTANSGDIRSTPVAEDDSDVLLEDGRSTADVETTISVTSTETPESAILATVGKGNADVFFVKAQPAGDNRWTFVVTVEHPDMGWEDYADGWDVVLPDGIVIKPDPESPFTRLLLHPHETEQPFTRSQSGIEIPPNVEKVIVRAHDLMDGFGGKEVVVDLTVERGSNFEVIR